MRILRYFRFYGRVCADETSHDTDSIKAIKENASGLAGIAGERIWIEFKKIVTGNFADSLIQHIVDTKVHVYIGFPEELDLAEFTRVFKSNLAEAPSAITMICSLFKDPKQFSKLLKRMRFSNDDKKLADFIFAFRDIEKDKLTSHDGIEIKLKPFKNILVDNVKDLRNMEKMKELLKYINAVDDYASYLEAWPIPIFPITGDHLAAKNIPKGPMYTKILNSLKASWKNELNFRTDEAAVEQLLIKCDEIRA